MQILQPSCSWLLEINFPPPPLHFPIRYGFPKMGLTTQNGIPKMGTFPKWEFLATAKQESQAGSVTVWYSTSYLADLAWAIPNLGFGDLGMPVHGGGVPIWEFVPIWVEPGVVGRSPQSCSPFVTAPPLSSFPSFPSQLLTLYYTRVRLRMFHFWV